MGKLKETREIEKRVDGGINREKEEVEKVKNVESIGNE